MSKNYADENLKKGGCHKVVFIPIMTLAQNGHFWPNIRKYRQIYREKINFSQIMPYKGESVKTLGGPPLTF